MSLKAIWRFFFPGHSLSELARRLDVSLQDLRQVEPHYTAFSIRKRSGRPRFIHAPDEHTRQLQRKILRRLLARLKTHPQATGFQPGVSFVDNARCHQLQSIVIRIDLVNFFPSIKAERVNEYFRKIGWSCKAARRLTELTTHEGSLPQGAPTSPRLSNLVNYLLDERLARLADSAGAIYTRYADDITFSFSEDGGEVHRLIGRAIRIIRQSGYRPHIKRKFDVRRRHQRQMVTGLVVNERVQLPRETRRWLRAVKHRARLKEQGGYLGPLPTLTDEQIAGWDNLVQMIQQRRLES